MSIVPVLTKGSKYSAPAETPYSVEVVKGKSISIFKDGKLCNSFGIGDLAEYDSYNLSYFGKITSISDKCVVIEEKYGKKRSFLNLYSFCFRNYDFDSQKAGEKNNEAMMSI